VEYPSRFMLVLSCNPCPCGNLGRRGSVCLCSPDEVRKYWKRLGGPLLDRIDIRMPVEPASPMELAQGPGESTASVKARVKQARSIQSARYAGTSPVLNGELSAVGIDRYCKLDGPSLSSFVARAEHASLSSRACHSILRLARTIADLSDSGSIQESHVDEAFDLRRYGDNDIFWVLP